MNSPLKIAVVGVGRIGVFHARFVQEVALQNGACELVAVADGHEDTADRVAGQLGANQEGKLRAFRGVEELVDSGICEAAIVASLTADHYGDAKSLVDAGCLVLLEKPLTHSVESAIEFARYLDDDERRRTSVMIAFMRRFDAGLVRAKQLLDEGAIGRVFKILSILEDPAGPPTGYSSAGLLADMGVHNADEVMWLLGKRPTAITGMGARLHNQNVSDVKEDFDDSFVQMWFDEETLSAQIQVGRNHVAGYRNETLVYGEEGMMHVGQFWQETRNVRFEAYSRDRLIESAVFEGRQCDPGVPDFIERFADAYVAEIVHFVEQCRAGEPFFMDHSDGLRAMQVVEAGMRSQRDRTLALSIDYG